MRRIRKACQCDHDLRFGHRGRLVGLATGALFVLLHSVLPVRADVGVWSGGLPEGGSVGDIVAAPADPLTLWAAAGVNGVFRSTDGGATWDKANNGVTPYVRDLAVTKVGSTVGLYAVSTSSFTPMVWRSTDGGTTWTSSGAGLEGTWPSDVAAPPSDLTTVYCVTRYDGVFKSTDGGSSFAPINAGLPIPLPTLSTLSVDPVSPAILYLGINQSNPGGVYKSTDAGATWSASNTGIESARIRHIVVDPVTPSTLYVTAASSDRLYKSTDSGATWAPAATGLTPGQTPRALAIDPSTPTTLYVAVFPGIFRSLDGAANWNDLGVPLQGASVGALLVEAPAVAPLAPEGGTPLLWAGTAYGVLRSTDGGTTWPESNSGLEAYYSYVISDPSQPATVYASDLGSGMVKTTDGGATWARINNGLTSVSFSMYLLDESVIAPTNPQVLYLGDVTEVYRTNNGGGLWNSTITDPSPFGIWGPYVTALAVDPVSASTVLAGNEAVASDGDPDVGPAVLRSTDSGATWSVLYTPPWVPPFGFRYLDPVSIIIDPTNPNRIYFSSFSGQSGVPGFAWAVLRSTDGGVSWSEELTGTNGLVYLAIDPVTPTILYAGVQGLGDPSGLFKSIDGGDTWNPLALPETSFASIAHSPRQSGRLWVGAESIYESLDGGVTWSEMDTSGLPPDFHRVYSLAATDSEPITVYAGTNAGVYSHTEEESPIIFTDGFESGDTSAWSSTRP